VVRASICMPLLPKGGVAPRGCVGAVSCPVVVWTRCPTPCERGIAPRRSVEAESHPSSCGRGIVPCRRVDARSHPSSCGPVVVPRHRSCRRDPGGCWKGGRRCGKGAVLPIVVIEALKVLSERAGERCSSNEKWFEFEHVGQGGVLSHATNSATAAPFRTLFLSKSILHCSKLDSQ
jgi:hypothetical protein